MILSDEIRYAKLREMVPFLRVGLKGRAVYEDIPAGSLIAVESSSARPVSSPFLWRDFSAISDRLQWLTPLETLAIAGVT